MKKLQQIIILVFTLTIVSCSSESHSGKINLKEGKEVTTGYIEDTHGHILWKVNEIIYDGEKYIILYPRQGNNRDKVIITKK